MNKKKTLRAVLVGCGGMSRAWLNVAQERSDLQIVGLVDIDLNTAKKRAEEYGLDNVTIDRKLDSVLSAMQPDVVFDVTIPDAHTEVTVTALKRGCHVLGEKPLSDSMVNARKSIRAAERAGKIYAVIQNRRYNVHIRRLRRLVVSGAIGDLTTVNCDFYLGAHFGGFRDRMKHVLLLDMAIHTFDQARLITGADPVSVYCREWNPAGSWYDYDASAICIFEMSNGLIFTYRGSWCAEGLNTSWECDWRIVGTRGSATWDGGGLIKAQSVKKANQFHSVMKDVKVPVLARKDRIGGHAGLIDEFIHCVRSGQTPETICTDNVKSLAMVFASIESAQKGRTVKIKY
ncbi:MAG: Gfo/Idh/MocA family oxidoreductase [Candidatus Latescibacterota bacterium]|nr:Gfo/Idh/MocA family oxidoreductase [Candidatus Latescibacterota bacterium]